ncbi:MAG: hypothetical protein ABIM21_04885 [candidate division WOR-3 bacterium]
MNSQKDLVDHDGKRRKGYEKATQLISKVGEWGQLKLSPQFDGVSSLLH